MSRRGEGGLLSLGEVLHRIETDEIKARPTMYRGIEFRSRLEVRFAWHLDEQGEQWVYEPRIYGDHGHGYLPDFEILGTDRPTFIEVKPTLAEVGAAKRKMEIIWDTHPDAMLIVACAEECRYYSCHKGGEWLAWQERWAS